MFMGVLVCVCDLFIKTHVSRLLTNHAYNINNNNNNNNTQGVK